MLRAAATARHRLHPEMSHFIADDGEKIHVHVSGEGRPLILLHGWTANHMEWSPFMRALNGQHRVYRWDARGHTPDSGDPPRSDPTLPRMARDLRQLIDHFGLDNVSILGHSMGAMTLWQYVRDFGTAGIHSLCFIDQSPKLLTDADWRLGVYGDFDARRSQAFVDSLHEDFAEGVLKLVAFGKNSRAREGYLANTPAWESTRQRFRALTPKPLIRCWKSMTEADYRDVLAQIDVPTLLIYGGQSNFYSTETAHYVANAIPKAILRIYEGEDHSPHLWQRERFTKELLEFLAE